MAVLEEKGINVNEAFALQSGTAGAQQLNAPFQPLKQDRS